MGVKGYRKTRREIKKVLLDTEIRNASWPTKVPRVRSFSIVDRKQMSDERRGSEALYQDTQQIQLNSARLTFVCLIVVRALIMVLPRS